MSIYELDAKVNQLRELRTMEAELKTEMSRIENELKEEMLWRQTEELCGRNCRVSWKTVITNRFDSAAFKMAHGDLFQKFCRATSTRRLVIA